MADVRNSGVYGSSNEMRSECRSLHVNKLSCEQGGTRNSIPPKRITFPHFFVDESLQFHPHQWIFFDSYFLYIPFFFSYDHRINNITFCPDYECWIFSKVKQIKKRKEKKRKYNIIYCNEAYFKWCKNCSSSSKLSRIRIQQNTWIGREEKDVPNTRKFYMTIRFR